jgi:integrase
VLGAVLAFAVGRGLRADNPARGVKLNKGRKIERFLSAGELARLGEALAAAEREGCNPAAIAAIRLLLLTGCRKNEILGLRWEWVDTGRGLLRLPDSKTGAKAVPLGAPALVVLAGLPRRMGSPWVLPAAKGNGHLVGLPRVWGKIAKAAGLTGVRLHDLRHGFASVAVADGASLYILGKVLGHTQARTTEKYAHLDDDPVRAVADRTAKKIAAAMQGQGTADNVVTMQRGGK